MPNTVDRFFSEATRKIPDTPTSSYQEAPHPDHPEAPFFDPAEIAKDDDYLISADEEWEHEETLRNIPDKRNTSRISEDDRSLLDGALREVGIDVYAFYKSRRFLQSRPYVGKWGIFYLAHGVCRVAEIIRDEYPGYGDPRRLAYDFLRAHERFHFKFDMYALATEAQLGKGMYELLKYAFRHHKVYEVEEALANREAWEWAKQSRIGLKEFAYDFMKLQPAAYARFDEDKTALSSELAANFLDLDLSRHARRSDQSLWVGTVPKELLRRSLCPEYFVRPAALTNWISPAWKLPQVLSIVESESVANLLESKYVSIRERWEDTKRKLVSNPALRGLDFKRWDKSTGHWSVRIDGNFRAHLHPVSQPKGSWEADELGPHKAMGHG